MKRTHGVCLRWLAERFRQPDVRLYYERSVLQAADIYTKGFTVPAEWDRVVRLVNLLDPMRFWGRSREILAGQMGSEHKGGVSFSYWTPNPWYGRESMTIPTPCSVDASSSAAPILISKHERDAHVPWIVPPVKGGLVAATTADDGRGSVTLTMYLTMRTTSLKHRASTAMSTHLHAPLIPMMRVLRTYRIRGAVSLFGGAAHPLFHG